MDEYYQSVIISLTSGETFIYSGKGNILSKREEKRNIKSIVFTKPKRLGYIDETPLLEEVTTNKEA